MAIQSHFAKFHNKIKLTRESGEYSDAREKDDSILKKMRTAFKDAGYSIIDDFIQGSLATHTAIKSKDGDFDIDRAIVIDNDKAPENPVDAKKVALGVLENRGFKNAKIKKPCVTADYAQLALHIDIPIYSKSGDNYKLAVGKANSGDNNREWSDADPKGLISWINNRDNYADSPDATQQQFIRLVRCIKRWRDFKFSNDVRAKVYSIGLSVMLKQHFNPSFDNEGRPNDLQALKDTVNEILTYGGYFRAAGQDQYKVSVMLPVTPYRDIFDNSSVNTGTQLRNQLNTLNTKLDEVFSEEDEVKQCKILNKVFGDDFEVPERSKKVASSLAAFSSAGVVGTSQGA